MRGGGKERNAVQGNALCLRHGASALTTIQRTETEQDARVLVATEA